MNERTEEGIIAYIKRMEAEGTPVEGNCIASWAGGGEEFMAQHLGKDSFPKAAKGIVRRPSEEVIEATVIHSDLAPIHALLVDKVVAVDDMEDRPLSKEERARQVMLKHKWFKETYLDTTASEVPKEIEHHDHLT